MGQLNWSLKVLLSLHDYPKNPDSQLKVSWDESPTQDSYPMASSEFLNSSLHCNFIGIDPMFQSFD